MTDNRTYNEETIKHLLERFMDGDTSLEEEQQLASYFRQSDVMNPGWQPYKQMFAYFDAGMPEQPSQQLPTTTRAKRWWHSRRMYWAAAASLVALLAGLAVTLWTNKESPTAITKPQNPSLPPSPLQETEGLPSNTTQFIIPNTKEDKKTAVMMATTPQKAKKTIKATKQPATNSHEKLQEPATKQPDDEVMEAMIEEMYANRKIAIIQAALKQRGYEPVIEEEGYVTFQRETEPVITKEQEPINI